jgi:hypothetical protein
VLPNGTLAVRYKVLSENATKRQITILYDKRDYDGRLKWVIKFSPSFSTFSIPGAAASTYVDGDYLPR